MAARKYTKQTGGESNADVTARLVIHDLPTMPPETLKGIQGWLRRIANDLRRPDLYGARFTAKYHGGRFR